MDFQWRLAIGDDTLTGRRDRRPGRHQGTSSSPRTAGRGERRTPEARSGVPREAGQTEDRRRGAGSGRQPPRRPQTPLPVTGISADGWLGVSAGSPPSALTPVEPPESFAATLRPYQSRGLSWLSYRHVGSRLLPGRRHGPGQDRPGAGPELAHAPPAGRPHLLVCPTSVVGNWQRRPPLRARTCASRPPRRRRLARRRFAAWWPRTTWCSPPTPCCARVEALARPIPGPVVLDEAQNIKNPARARPSGRALPPTTASRSPARRWRTAWPTCGRSSSSSTPASSGSAAPSGASSSCPSSGSGDDGAAERCASCGPFILRRLKTDQAIIADLPDKMEMKVFCPHPGAGHALRGGRATTCWREIDAEGIERRGLVLAALTKLKQVCNHPAQFLGDGSRSAGRIGQAGPAGRDARGGPGRDDRALVFTQFAEMGAPAAAAPAGAVRARGAVPARRHAEARERDRMVDRFQDDGRARRFVLSLKAGGTGLNLTAANHVFHFDRWWNPAVENQATDSSPRDRRRLRHRPSAGQPGPALPGAHRHERLRKSRVGPGRRGSHRAQRVVPRQPLGGRYPTTSRKSLHRNRPFGLPSRPAPQTPSPLDCSCPDWEVRPTTSPPPSTCWPSPSTRTRSGSSPGAAVNAMTSSTTCTPRANRQPTRHGRRGGHQPAAGRVSWTGSSRSRDWCIGPAQALTRTSLLDQGCPRSRTPCAGTPSPSSLRPAYETGAQSGETTVSEMQRRTRPVRVSRGNASALLLRTATPAHKTERSAYPLWP